MTRRVLIAGNWKMNKTPAETEAFIAAFLQFLPVNGGTEILLLPPFTSLDRAGGRLAGTTIALGAQDLHVEEAGAFTGEVSAAMLRACGCTYVLVGHSERRTLFHEDDSLINRKLQAALAGGLGPILCVGETLEEHRQGRVEERIIAQLAAGLDGVSRAAMRSVVIAYEPLWAIGTGETATPEIAEQAIRRIREWIAATYDHRTAVVVRILYGGSVKPENTALLVAQPNIDGALVGGASLDPDSFALIVAQAS